jgi:hypothetical protein
VLSVLVTALVTLIPGFAGLVGQPSSEAQTISRTLQWPAGGGGHLLELSNINGSIHIVAEDRADVAVVAVRTVQRQGAADDRGPEVDFRSEGDRLLVCGDGSHCGCHLENRGERRHDDESRTTVRVDFDVRVPKKATLDVCAINGGPLHVAGTEGRYALRNVNGDLQMERVRGAGRATTVNGDIDASFLAAPDAPSEFKTVNGRVKVTLPPSLSADLRLKTMNGGLYTDFDTAPLPARPGVQRRNGRSIYTADRFASVRVGQGGPELTFETLNGDVQVRKQAAR